MEGDIVSIVGYLMADPDLRFTSPSAAIVRITVASLPRVFDQQCSEWTPGAVLLVHCEVSSDAAESIAKSLVTNSRVIVAGRLKRHWYGTHEGGRCAVVEVEAEEIGLINLSPVLPPSCRGQANDRYCGNRNRHGAR